MSHYDSYPILSKQVKLDQKADLLQFCLSMNSPELFNQIVSMTADVDNNAEASAQSQSPATVETNREADPDPKEEEVVLNFRKTLADLGLAYVNTLAEGFEDEMRGITAILQVGGVGIFLDAVSEFKKKLEEWDTNELEILKRFARILLDGASEKSRQALVPIYSKVISSCTKFAFEQQRAVRILIARSQRLEFGISAAVKENDTAAKEAQKALRELMKGQKSPDEKVMSEDRFSFKRLEHGWEVIRVN